MVQSVSCQPSPSRMLGNNGVFFRDLSDVISKFADKLVGMGNLEKDPVQRTVSGWVRTSFSSVA